MMEHYKWVKEPPESNGDYFYNGPLPYHSGNVMLIVQIVAHSQTGERVGCVFIPAGWRDDKSRTQSTVHCAALEFWRGEWSGPKGGLCQIKM